MKSCNALVAGDVADYASVQRPKRVIQETRRPCSFTVHYSPRKLLANEAPCRDKKRLGDDCLDGDGI